MPRQHCRIAPDRRQNVVAPVPELLPLRNDPVFTGNQGVEQQSLALTSGRSEARLERFQNVLVGAEEIENFGAELLELREDSLRATKGRVSQRLC